MLYSIFINVPKKIKGSEFADLGKDGFTKITLPNYKNIQDGFQSKCEIIFNTLYALHHLQSKGKWKNSIFISYINNTYTTVVEGWMVEELFRKKDIKHAFKKKCRFYYDVDLIMSNHGFKFLAEVKKYVRVRINEILNKEKTGFDEKILQIIEVAKVNGNIVDEKTIETVTVVKTKKTLYKYYKTLKEIDPSLIVLSKDYESRFYRLTINKTFTSITNLNDYLVNNNLSLSKRTLKKYIERFAINFPEVNTKVLPIKKESTPAEQVNFDELFGDIEILKNSTENKE